MDDRTLKHLIIIIAVLLFVQYWLGMTTNLFVTVPTGAPLAFLSYTGGLEVLAHIVNGSLIFIVGVGILWASTKQGKSLLPKLSLLALVSVAAAVATGLLFILRGQNNSFSIAMAMSFLTAYTVYFVEYMAT